jgi:hypothetical protein
MMLDRALEGTGMKLESEKNIRFEDYSGREYELQGELGNGLGRAFIIGSTTYFMIGISVENKDGTAEITRFFDSFRLTKKPDPAPATGSLSAGTPSLREFSEPGHGFKVLLPGEPKKESFYFRSFLMFKLTSAGDGILCRVMRQREPSSPGAQVEIDSIYKSFINRFAKSSGIEVESETKVVLDGQEGREYKLKKNESTGAVRVFRIGEDTYSVTVFAILPGVSEKSILTILDSFKFIEKSPKDEFDELPQPPPPPPLPKPRKPEEHL